MSHITNAPVEFGLSYLSALGTLETAELSPILQMDFVYGINTQTGIATVSNGVVDTNGGRLRLQSGTNSAGSATFLSRKPAKYRPGQGVTARFTPVFATGVPNSTQIIGLGNETDGYFFGYNGASFGILHRRGGVDTWTSLENWDASDEDGSSGTAYLYDKTKGTPVMIKYPYLGYGNISFYLQRRGTSRWSLVHTIHYSNTTNVVQVSNPSLSFYAQVLNAGNTTNLTMYCGSVGVFLSGIRSFTGSPKWAVDSNKSGVTTEINLLTLKNATSYNGVTNRGLLRLNSISISSSAASGVVVFRFKVGATLGGSPSYTPVNGTTGNGGATITNGHSLASYDVAGTTITNGMYQWGATVDNPNSSIIDLIPYDLFIAPGETGTISGFSTVTSALGVVLNWSEDI